MTYRKLQCQVACMPFVIPSAISIVVPQYLLNLLDWIGSQARINPARMMRANTIG